MKKWYKVSCNYIAALLLYLLVSSCSYSYLNPEKIDLIDFDNVKKELSDRSTMIDSLFLGPNTKVITRYLELRDFQYNKALIKKFPNCYKVLKENKATEIDWFSKDCIFIILKKHTGFFTDRLECLKISKLNNCSLSNLSETSIEKESLLKNGWKYQIVIQYIDT